MWLVGRVHGYKYILQVYAILQFHFENKSSNPHKIRIIVWKRQQLRAYMAIFPARRKNIRIRIV